MEKSCADDSSIAVVMHGNCLFPCFKLLVPVDLMRIFVLKYYMELL